MKKFAKFICEHKNLIIGFSVVLFVLSLIGNALTHINYDILVYLPDNIDTIKGQNILTDDFGMGGYSIAIMDGMDAKQIVKLKEDLQNINGVGEVISLYDIVGTTVPIEMLPKEIISKLHDGNSDLLFITFTDSTSSELTLQAVSEIRNITEEHVKLGGMSSMVLDTMNLSNKEIAIYIIIAVALCIIVLELALDSFIVPILLLLNIGIAIIFNLGSNIFLGQISYITKALVAVLQLGVTTDFSIFLYHSYEAKKKIYKNHKDAMVEAICETFTSVTGSSLTTIIGFLVLITMNLTLGTDLGIVMAKGVALGVITVLTLFPSLLLASDKLIDKTKHKTFIPNFSKIYKFVIKYHKGFFAGFLILLVPFYLAQANVDVYYKIDKTLPDTLESIAANKILKDKFNMVSMEIVLLDKNLKQNDMNNLIKDLENTEGIDFVLSMAKLQELNITNDIIPEDLKKVFISDKYQMLMFNSIYDIASDDLNKQVEIVDEIVKKYDRNALVAGEGPLMKDLIEISNTDFNNVNVSSIVCIFFVLFFVLKSLSLPFLLIIAIEFAIFLNMGIAYFSGNILPFVAPIVLGTIQLGATIDYAILMTTTYLEKRKSGLNKKDAMYKTLEYSGNSIFVSGMCFFAATFGVGVYSDLEMVGSLCSLISRGAIISMIVVITILPSILLIFDKLIMKTTIHGKDDIKMKNKNLKKLGLALIIGGALFTSSPLNTYALIKDETVYTKLNYDGTINNTLVNTKLINNENLEEIEDYTILNDILNLSNDNTYKPYKDRIIWNSYKSDITYRGTTTKTLPITTNVTYYLNDIETNLNDMIGKSGKIKIVVKYQNTDKHIVKINGKNESLYTPFMVMLGTIIDDEYNKNISVSNGKVINNGINNIIIGIATPGLYESLNLNELKKTDTITISFDTTKFELASIYSVATPKTITSSDVNDFKDLNSLYSKVNDLQSGIDKIQTGVKDLSSGSSTLDVGIKELNNGIIYANTMFQEIKAGSASLNNGINKLANTLDAMMLQVNSIMTDANTLMNSFNANTLNDLTTLIKANDSTIKEFEVLINSLPDDIKQQIMTPDMTIKLASLSKLHTNNEKTIKNLNDISAKLNSIKNEIVSLQNKISNIKALQDGVNTLKNGANNLTIGIEAFDTQALKTLVSGSNSLKNGASSLNTGVKTLENGIVTYNKNGISKISYIVNNDVKGMSNRVQALVNLSENYNSFAGKTNNTTSETKFVMVIDGKKDAKKEIKTTEKQEKISIWQRFINLFK